MPHRQQEFLELCVFCKARTPTGCLRCAKPLCTQHAPGKNRRCDECEAEFRDKLLRREAKSADRALSIQERHDAAMVITLPWLTGLWVKTAVKWAWLRTFSRHRRRFLAERTSRAEPQG